MVEKAIQYLRGYHNGNGKVVASNKSFDTLLIATNNSNSVKKSGRSGGEASVETSCTFTASYINAIIACGSSVNDGGGTDGLNSNQPRAYVYATKEGSTYEVQCTWNSTRKCYEVPDKSVKYTKVRASNYGFSGSQQVHAMIGCLYVFGN